MFPLSWAETYQISDAEAFDHTTRAYGPIAHYRSLSPPVAGYTYLRTIPLVSNCHVWKCAVRRFDSRFRCLHVPSQSDEHALAPPGILFPRSQWIIITSSLKDLVHWLVACANLSDSKSSYWLSSVIFRDLRPCFLARAIGQLGYKIYMVLAPNQIMLHFLLEWPYANGTSTMCRQCD
jgi:hypothetical protein